MGSRYYVYRNLHKKCWSVKKDGKVVAHHQHFAFDGSTDSDYFGFKVNEGGRQRVLKEKRKNVHAYCWGWYPHTDEVNIKCWLWEAQYQLVQVTYNPYEAGYFKEVVTGKEIISGHQVFFTPKGLYVYQPRWKE